MLWLNVQETKTCKPKEWTIDSNHQLHESRDEEITLDKDNLEKRQRNNSNISLFQQNFCHKNTSINYHQRKRIPYILQKLRPSSAADDNERSTTSRRSVIIITSSSKLLLFYLFYNIYFIYFLICFFVKFMVTRVIYYAR